MTPQERQILEENGIYPKKVDGKMVYPNATQIHGILRKPLTIYDTPAIIESRYRTARNGSLDISEVPAAVKDNIIERIYEQAEMVPKERKLVIITGRCGAGKSTIVKQNGWRDSYMEMDADELIKPNLPGFDEYGASYVHKASVALNERIICDMLTDGTNLIIPTTGWGDYVSDIIGMAKSNGYSIEIVHSNVTPENSCMRAISRFVAGERLPDGSLMHRVVDPYAIIQGTYVDEVIPRFKNCIYIDKTIVYDNNGSSVVLSDKIYKKGALYE